MRKTRTNRALSLESLETRVALASDVIVTAVLLPIHHERQVVIVYRIVSVDSRPAQYQKSVLQGEGEGADSPTLASMRAPSPNRAIRDQTMKVESTRTPNEGSFSSTATSTTIQNNSMIAAKPKLANTPNNPVIDAPIAVASSPAGFADAPRTRVSQTPWPAPSLKTSAWATLDSVNATPSVDSVRNAIKTFDDPSSSRLQTAPSALFASIMPSSVASRHQSNETSLTDALKLRNESLRKLSTVISKPSNVTSGIDRVIAEQPSHASGPQSRLELDRALGFSKCDVARQSPDGTTSSESDQLPTMIGVMRSLDVIAHDDVLGPNSETLRAALLAVVAEFEQGTDRRQELSKESEHRGMSTAGSILVAAYAAIVARRKRKQDRHEHHKGW